MGFAHETVSVRYTKKDDDKAFEEMLQTSLKMVQKPILTNASQKGVNEPEEDINELIKDLHGDEEMRTEKKKVNQPDLNKMYSKKEERK